MPGWADSGLLDEDLAGLFTEVGEVKKGLCYSPRWGMIDFTVPLFDGFVRRRWRDPSDVPAA